MCLFGCVRVCVSLCTDYKPQVAGAESALVTGFVASGSIHATIRGKKGP